MASSSVLTHPVVADLMDQRSALRAALAQAFLERDTMLAIERPALLARIEVTLGPWRHRELAESNNVAKAERLLEFIGECLRLGRPFVPADFHLIAEREFTRSSARVREAARVIDAAELLLSATPMTADEVRVMKRHYRALALAVHPQLNPNQPQQDADLWSRVQAAWAEQDLDALETFAGLFVTRRTDEALAFESIEQLHADIEALQSQHALVSRELVELSAQAPFTLAAQLDDPTWVAAQREASEAHAATLKQRVEFLTEEVRRHGESGDHQPITH